MSAMQKMMHYEKREDAFTLIELLIVILIIGILAAIAIPMFLNQRKTAVDASLRSDLHQMNLILETWKIKNPTAPVVNFAYREVNTTNPNGSHNNANYSYNPSPNTYMKVNYKFQTEGEGYCIQAWNAGSSENTTEDTAMAYSSFRGVIGVGC